MTGRSRRDTAGQLLHLSRPSTRDVSPSAEHDGSCGPGWVGVTGLDSEVGQWRAFLAAWLSIYGQHPVTARELCRSAAGVQAARWAGTFPTTSHGQLPTARSLARLLGARIATRVDGFVLRRVRDARTKIHVYWLAPAHERPGNRIAGHPNRTARTATARDRAPGTDTGRTATAPTRPHIPPRTPVGPGPFHTHQRIGLRLPVRQQT